MKINSRLSIHKSLLPIIDNYAFRTVLISGIITILFLCILPSLKFENTPDKFGLPSDDPVKIERDNFESLYNPGQLILVGLSHNTSINIM